MIGLGTVINTAAIIVGGIGGKFFGKLLKERHQESLKQACGVSVLFIAIGGALEKMVKIEDNSLVSGQAMLIVLSLVLGALIGEIINFEGLFTRFGEWLKKKTGNAGDKNFVDAFLTTTFTVCIGAMAIVGSIEDGINGDYSILLTKSVLDLIIVIVMSSTLGKGCVFSAIPILVLEGGMTLLARVIKPIMTASALNGLSLVGSILIFCVGINLVWDKKIRVANFLPALIFAAIGGVLLNL